MAGDAHYFVVAVGTHRGNTIMEQVPFREATPDEVAASEQVVRATARQMGRHMETTGIKEPLYRNYEHPRWDNVAQWCLTCANCTMVCPTCFCSTVEDSTDLTGQETERRRR